MIGSLSYTAIITIVAASDAQTVYLFADLIDFEAEVIGGRLTSSPLCQECQGDGPVPDVGTGPVRFAGLVHQTSGDLLHAEDRLIEFALFVVVLGMGGDVAD